MGTSQMTCPFPIPSFLFPLSLLRGARLGNHGAGLVGHWFRSNRHAAHHKFVANDRAHHPIIQQIGTLAQSPIDRAPSPAYSSPRAGRRRGFSTVASHSPDRIQPSLCLRPVAQTSVACHLPALGIAIALAQMDKGSPPSWPCCPAPLQPEIQHCRRASWRDLAANFAGAMSHPLPAVSCCFHAVTSRLAVAIRRQSQHAGGDRQASRTSVLPSVRR